jgi:hypothetical protein
MNWGPFVKRFLLVIVAAPLLAALLLGTIGFLVTGESEGFVNGAGWGVVLGFVAVPFLAFMIYAQYWGDYSGRYGAAHIKKETEGDNR